MEYEKDSKFPFKQSPFHKSIRLPDYDYTQPGAYFITICTHERKSLLGNITVGKMELNPNGEIAQSCWESIKEHFTNTELSAYVIMPNHIHGIIIISSSVAARHAVPQQNPHAVPQQNPHAVPGDVGKSLKITIPASESFGKPVIGSLPTIIRSFKSAVTKHVNVNSGNRQSQFWQKGYYEHVIRSEGEFVQISEYILNNPIKWELDRENPYALKKVKPLPFEY